MIGHAVLGEIVGADFFGAVAGLDLPPAFGGESGLTFFLLLFVQSRAENAHGLGAILDLRFFVLLGNDEAAGNVRDAHGGIRSVDGLAAGAGRTEGVNAQVLGFDLDVDFVGFGEDRDGSGGSVNAALRFRGGDARAAGGPPLLVLFWIYTLPLR